MCEICLKVNNKNAKKIPLIISKILFSIIKAKIVKQFYMKKRIPEKQISKLWIITVIKS